MTETKVAQQESPPSPWSPLLIPMFRALWIAQLFSNIGTWMQNVGASWLMGDLGGSPTQIALVQTATSLPVFVVGLIAGATADIVDRRKLLLISQGWMLVAAGALALATHFDAITPVLLLVLTFALGLGSAMTLPAWSAIQPELVPRSMIPQAVSLGSITMNVGRSLGPAIGGVVVATLGAAAVFGLNALSFVGILIVIALWRRPKVETSLPAERLWKAVRTGLRYGRHSPALRALLIRTVLFVLPGSALLALLPVVARESLHLGSGGFGVLFAMFGVGAIAVAPALPRLREFGVDRVLVFATFGIALALLTTGFIHSEWLVAPAMFIGGASWVAALTTFNVSAQSVLPAWVRARGMGLYLLVFQGGLALGSAVWGSIASIDLAWSLGLAAVVAVAGNAGINRWRLKRDRVIDVSIQSYWPEPVLTNDVSPDHGPVLITVQYEVIPGKEQEFTAEMQKVKRIRQRTGAHRWGLYRDSSVNNTYVETFLVDSWEEHLRQHQRTTATDQRIQESVWTYLAPDTEPRASHLIWAY